ncbi:hypothetical protein M378DRAFT_16423 [Amanita muscaria Koide BX008]|uniref:Uncharacterized protein n=1 Tax=Amanita muscaria (strain Koide BX008) TaxID=946122 RepID=A0A0C2S3G0_AMAMK|nr:hypothetical protein M378DRAFT_16423 [Amanita muscaria Koide BX008]
MSNAMKETADGKKATEGYMMEKMENTRQALLEGGMYIGAGELENRPKLKWERLGKADYVVSAEDTSRNNADKPNSDSRDASETLPEPAILTTVVQISEDDFWLTLCGMYKGPSPMVPTLGFITCETEGVPFAR